MNQIARTAEFVPSKADALLAALAAKHTSDLYGPAAVKRSARALVARGADLRRRFTAITGVDLGPDHETNVARLRFYMQGQRSLLKDGYAGGSLPMLHVARCHYVAERYARLRDRAEERNGLIGERYSRFGFAWERVQEAANPSLLTVEHRPNGTDFPFVIARKAA